MKNKGTNTLTFKLWLYFIVFAILLFIILWFMQVIFLQSYYSSMKKSEVIRLSEDIKEEYLKGNYEESIDKLAYKNGITVYAIDLEGNVKYTSGSVVGNINNLNSNINNNMINQAPTRPNNLNVEDLIKRIKENNSKKISYTFKLDRFKTEVFVYGIEIDEDGTYLVLVSSIDPIDATTNVLQSQLAYVTIIALLISSIVSLFLSRRISRPIQDMTSNANKLAKGNYDIEFKKAGYKEIDELADALNYATSRLAETDKVRKELIANVSHDLKTPLTMIKAYSEMIRDLSGENKEKREEHLKVIIDETDRLTRLVSDMMDLSKIESGFTTLTKTIFNLSDTAKQIINGFDIIKYKDCDIKVDIPDEAYVLADKTKIEQVIYNLVANAINHSGDEKRIHIKITNSGKRVKFLVEDNGPGISKEDLKNIWNRYYRSSSTFKRASSGGTGLGLSIVKNILDKHNSNYGVDSVVGKGSTFYFDLEKANKKEIKNNENGNQKA